MIDFGFRIADFCGVRLVTCLRRALCAFWRGRQASAATMFPRFVRRVKYAGQAESNPTAEVIEMRQKLKGDVAQL